jgi:hypothetical protein
MNIAAPKPQKRPTTAATAKTQLIAPNPKSRINKHIYNQKEQVHQSKTLPSYLRNVQSKERGLIARDKMKATKH